MSDYIILDGELYHYGVKGQKWGVRRYQNKDGTLTKAGKEHKKQSAESDARLFSRIKNGEDYDGYASLMREIEKKSGNWYEGTPVSEGFKKALTERKAEEKRLDKKYKYVEDLRKKLREVEEQLMEKYYPLSEFKKDSNEVRDRKMMAAVDKRNADPAYKEAREKYWPEYLKQYKEQNRATAKFQSKLAGVVLKDLGYEDTTKGRQFLLDQGVIFWD